MVLDNKAAAALPWSTVPVDRQKGGENRHFQDLSLICSQKLL